MGFINTLEKIFRGTTAGDDTGTPARTAGQMLNSNMDKIDSALEEINNSSEKTANKATNLDAPNNTKYPTTQAVSNAVAAQQTAWQNYVASELTGFQQVSEKGAANGYAPLDAQGMVPAGNLPAYVEEIVEGTYVNTTTFNDGLGDPVTPETNKLYVDTGNSKVYRWGGSVFTEIVASPGSTDEVPEGNNNKYFTADRVRAVLLTGYEVITGFVVNANDTIVAAIGKLQGQINSLGTLLSNKLDKAGYTGTAQDLKNLIDTKQTALQVQTLIDQNESTALDKRMNLLAADLDSAEKDAIKTKLGIVEGGGSAPQPDYADKAALLADQANQIAGVKYTMLNANGWNDPEDDEITHNRWATVKYLGTTNGDESDYDLREQFDVDASGGSETLSRQTVITTNTTLNGSETLGLSKYTPINSDTDLVVTVDKGTHAVGQVHNFRKNGNGQVKFIKGTNVLLEGKRNKDGEFILMNKGNFASLIFDREESGVLIGSVIGDIQGGYIESTYNPSNIKHYYPLETNANDSVGAINGTASNITFANGKADFNGTNSYIDLADNDSLSFVSGGEDQDFSISFMVNFDTISAAIFLINKFINSSTGEYRVALTNTLDKVILELRDANNSNATISGDAENLTLTTGVDYHITATHQAGINKIYIDAIDETDAQSVFGSYSSMVNNTSPVRIGGRSYETSNMLDGKMWGVAFWDKALSQTEVTAIKTRQKDNGLQLV